MKNNNKETVEANTNQISFAFGKVNYILLVVGLVVLAIGYLLLTGGGSDDPNVFNAEMFNARRMYVAPIMIMLGFLIEIVAIMLKPRKADNDQQ